MITITLRHILDAKPCYDPRNSGFIPADHDLDAPITFREIREKAGAADTVWCFAKAMTVNDALKLHFAVDCSERVRHLMTDERSLNALAVARRYALSDASDNELMSAEYAAWAAAWAAKSAACENAKREEVQWQADRIIELAESGEWSPVE